MVTEIKFDDKDHNFMAEMDDLVHEDLAQSTKTDAVNKEVADKGEAAGRLGSSNAEVKAALSFTPCCNSCTNLKSGS